MSHLLLLVNVLAVSWMIVGSTEYTDIVQTNNGPIKGEELTFDGTQYKAFKGIPYAAPPVGDLRFRLGENGLMPVLVWIDSFGFFGGGALDEIFGPDYLIQEDMVIVSINYRLGFLGFLSTNTSDASGNWGLKDQVAALKWVQENIEHFGGDPTQVTLYGHSTGAACVHLHLFSPLSEGLFHKVILASGSATNDWTFTSPTESVRFSKFVARRMGASEKEVEDPAERVNFLRAVLANGMIKRRYYRRRREGGWEVPYYTDGLFTPVIENPGTEGAFVTEHPKELIREGRFAKVPMMIGVTDLEAVPYLLYYGGNITARLMKKTEEKVCEILPAVLRQAVEEKDGCAKVAREISAVYFDDKPFNSSELNYLNLRGDLLLVLGVHLAERMHTKASDKNSPIYKYQFSFDGELTRKIKLRIFGLPGAAHRDDLTYIFKINNGSVSQLVESDSPDIVTRDRMVRFIANFVQHGDPTPSVSDLIPVKWEPATTEESKTMVIGNELKMEKEFLKSRMDMWDRLYTEYTGSPLFS